MSVIFKGSKFFTKNNLMKLIEDSSKLQDLVDCAQNNHERLEVLYKELIRYYRNEYVYKNTLFNKLVLGKHSLKTTSAIVELPIEDSIADFILFNGKAVVYEIKTELDSLERLKKQLTNYYKAFDTVNVVIAEKHFDAVYSLLSDSPVGIIILTDRMTLSEKKKADIYKGDLDPKVWFSILRKYEFEDLLLSYYGKLPAGNDFEYYDICKQVFLKIDEERLYKLFIYQLKQRNLHKYKDISINYDYIPKSIRSLVYFSNFKRRDYLKLIQFLGH
ncbi:sce7726 family protein [Veillonella agrestimuris]|uniref:sce7726 family protein n=1 Tax=Veillonella agrestimuris TaxID=2941340 RepID=UPI00203FEA93|nr:sce7726 family protein [Veillonella agrestimuris]